MTPSRNTRIAITATVVALAAAGAATAATKLGHVGSSTAPHAFGHRFDGRGPGDPLAVASTYLGISETDLVTQLQAGKTLAQIANATSGKSESGLVDALYAAATANLRADITKHVESTGPHGGGHDLAAAASYLGITPSALRTQLQAGKTLAQIADATSGKSSSGLVAALVASEKTHIEADVASGRLTRAQADQIESGLTDRITKLVNGQLPPHPDGPGPWGGPPPSNGTHI